MSYSRPNPQQQLNSALIQAGHAPQRLSDMLRAAGNTHAAQHVMASTPAPAWHLPMNFLWWKKG